MYLHTYHKTLNIKNRVKRVELAPCRLSEVGLRVDRNNGRKKIIKTKNFLLLVSRKFMVSYGSRLGFSRLDTRRCAPYARAIIPSTRSP